MDHSEEASFKEGQYGVYGLQKYQLHECIGKGNFGDVYKASHEGEFVAIKVLNLVEGKEEIKDIMQEISLLSRLTSPYITRYYETFVHETNMFIVMEFCGGRSMGEMLRAYKRVPEDVARYVMRDVMRGLCYLHQEGKVHRDIKSANILLTDNGGVKLADFGVSGELTKTHVKRNTFVGTPYWMAPEVISRKRTGMGYDEKADIWSAGITTIELLEGMPPLAKYDPMKILFEIPRNSPPELGGDFSDDIKDFVKRCLVKDPQARASAPALLCHRMFHTTPEASQHAHARLVRMIRKKGNKSVRPRYQICSEPEEEKPVIKWDFGTVLDRVKSLRMVLPETENSGNSENKNIENENENENENEHENENGNEKRPTGYRQNGFQIPRPMAENLQSSIPASHPLFLCLDKVYLRGRTEGSRTSVYNMMVYIAECEMQQPGLCDALWQEIGLFNTKEQE